MRQVFVNENLLRSFDTKLIQIQVPSHLSIVIYAVANITIYEAYYYGRGGSSSLGDIDVFEDLEDPLRAGSP